MFVPAWKTDKQAAMNIFKLLLDSGLDVNAVDIIAGCSVLHYATSENMPELVRFLIENTKIDTKLKNMKAGETALDLAVRKDYHEIVSMLKPNQRMNQVTHNMIYTC